MRPTATEQELPVVVLGLIVGFVAAIPDPGDELMASG